MNKILIHSSIFKLGHLFGCCEKWTEAFECWQTGGFLVTNHQDFDVDAFDALVIIASGPFAGFDPGLLQCFIAAGERLVVEKGHEFFGEGDHE